MEIVTIFLYLYIAIGTGYGVYLLLNGSSTIWWLPVNILGGPLVLVYLIYKTIRRENVEFP